MKYSILILSLLFSFGSIAQKAKPIVKPPDYRYMIIVDESEDFSKLDAEGQALAGKTSMKYNTRQMVYSAEKGKMILPANYEDEAYQGEYIERLNGENEISIEMKSSYTKATAKMMVIVAGIFTDKAKADLKLKELKKNAPKATILTLKV